MINVKRHVGTVAVVNISLTIFSFMVAQGCMKDKNDNQLAASVEELIGGVPADSPSLNAVGSLGTRYTYYDSTSDEEIVRYYPFCSGTLIGKRVVLTAKHCAVEARYGPIYFGIGPDGRNPDSYIEVIDYDLAPGDIGGWTGRGSDVGVLFLAKKAKGIKPFKFAGLKDEDIGQKYAAIGYGIQGNSYDGDTRRAGTVTLAALEGRIFEHMFGSFEAFVEWYTGGGYYGTWADDPQSAVDARTAPLPSLLPDPPPLIAVAEDELADEDAGIDMEEDAGFGDGGTDDGGSIDPYLEYLRSIYENTLLLEEYEAYVATLEGDSQPCFGDSGSPLVRPVDGQLTVFGVVTGGVRSSSLICDYGTIYSIFAKDTLQFIKESKQWEDPCGTVTNLGHCEGDIAVRCTNANEGSRRITRTDCSLLLQTCAVAENGAAACADPGGAMTSAGIETPPARPQSPEVIEMRIRNAYFGKNAENKMNRD